MSVNPSTAKKLYGLSAGRCNICKKRLHNRNYHAGEMAHIVAEKPTGPRGCANFVGDINGYDNLILLCVDHHTLIDQDTNTYTVAFLKNLKLQHEYQVDQLFTNGNDRASDVSALSVLMEYMPFIYVPGDVENLPYSFNIRLLEVEQAVEGFILGNPHMYPFYDTVLMKRFERFYTNYQEVIGALRWVWKDALIFDVAIGGFSKIKSDLFGRDEFSMVCSEITGRVSLMMQCFHDLVSYLRQFYKDVAINSYPPRIAW
ncbi:HNH endonuclease [Azospirillum brasilense]|uniref:HNH endonuclease n=1 Tax=Azospirillum brasilense TaxID=192 RepID=UPI0010BFF4ED|nr:HNH endonuclease [Azospirillum brasilense]